MVYHAQMYKTVESGWWSLLTISSWTNTISVIFKWDTFSPFSDLIWNVE